MANVLLRITDTNNNTGDFDIELTSTPAFPKSADDATLAQLYGTLVHGLLMDMLKDDDTVDLTYVPKSPDPA